MSNDIVKQDLSPTLAGLKEFAATPDQLIPMLQYAQVRMGYLAPEAMAAIAEYLRLPMSHVYGVATFYAQFRFRPLGKNRLTVCRGTACHVRGSARLVDEIERVLNIKAGETTPDMMFSIETVACLGSCALAPAVVVNDKVHGKMNARKLEKLIADLRGGVVAAIPAAPGKNKAAAKKTAKKTASRTTRTAPRPVTGSARRPADR
jgi:NADH-quinone oxidoreductase subunit E